MLEQFPRLTSGKIDRKSLLDPRQSSESNEQPLDADGWTDAELELGEAFNRVLAGVAVERGTNFFDNGGDSLAATELVSRLRKGTRFASVSVRDLYESPVLGALAAQFEASFPMDRDRDSRDMPHGSDRPRDDGRNIAPVPRVRYWLCGIAQTVALYPLLAIMSPPWMITFVAFYGIAQEQSQHRVTVAMLFAVVLVLASAPVRLVLCVAIKWVVLGRVRPGRHRLWGTYHLRFWFVNRVQDMLGIDQLRSTPLMNTYLKLMGATIGDGAHCATMDIRVPDLLTIGEGATVDHDAMLLGYQIADGWINIGRITIGAGARVGVRAAMAYDTEIGGGAELADGAMLSSGSAVPSKVRWAGSPAKADGKPLTLWPTSPPPATGGSRLGYSIGFTALSLIPAIAALPEALLFGYIDSRFCDFTKGYWDLWKLAVAAPFAAVGFIVTLSLVIAFIKRLVLPSMEAGVYPLRSNWHVRKWFGDSLMHISLQLMFPMYASVYLPPWMRLMGARLGKDVELSTAANMNPDLIDLRQGVFVADNVSLGASRTNHGWHGSHACRLPFSARGSRCASRAVRHRVEVGARRQIPPPGTPPVGPLRLAQRVRQHASRKRLHGRRDGSARRHTPAPLLPSGNGRPHRASNMSRIGVSHRVRPRPSRRRGGAEQ